MSFEHKDVVLDPPRELTEWEHAVLTKMLSVEFEGAEALRKQLPHTSVSMECASRPGCLYAELVVDRGKAERAKVARVPVPVTAFGRGTDRMGMVYGYGIGFNLFRRWRKLHGHA